MKINIDKVISEMEKFLDQLKDLKNAGCEQIQTESNTYFVGSNFVSIGSYGFIDLYDIKEIEDEDE